MSRPPGGVPDLRSPGRGRRELLRQRMGGAWQGLRVGVGLGGLLRRVGVGAAPSRRRGIDPARGKRWGVGVGLAGARRGRRAPACPPHRWAPPSRRGNPSARCRGRSRRPRPVPGRPRPREPDTGGSGCAPGSGWRGPEIRVGGDAGVALDGGRRLVGGGELGIGGRRAGAEGVGQCRRRAGCPAAPGARHPRRRALPRAHVARRRPVAAARPGAAPRPPGPTPAPPALRRAGRPPRRGGRPPRARRRRGVPRPRRRGSPPARRAPARGAAPTGRARPPPAGRNSASEARKVRSSGPAR